ncbi:MAG: L,D-transpeptidase family protein [Hyphomicrobiaceae bacterium]|nr:L,D-transpeptidase family protein [Hyphomicrobiaceae bacterium]
MLRRHVAAFALGLTLGVAGPSLAAAQEAPAPGSASTTPEQKPDQAAPQAATGNAAEAGPVQATAAGEQPTEAMMVPTAAAPESAGAAPAGAPSAPVQAIPVQETTEPAIANAPEAVAPDVAKPAAAAAPALVEPAAAESPPPTATPPVQTAMPEKPLTEPSANAKPEAPGEANPAVAAPAVPPPAANQPAAAAPAADRPVDAPATPATAAKDAAKDANKDAAEAAPNPATPAEAAPALAETPAPNDAQNAATLARLVDMLAVPVKGASDGDKADRAALAKFYAERQAPLWLSGDAPTAAAAAVIAEIGQAGEWGLDASAFDLPAGSFGATPATDDLAAFEQKLSVAALKYARFARGGRIPNPREMSSYLDRDPPLASPEAVLVALAAASEPARVLTSYHPRHEGFVRLKAKLAEMRQSVAAEEKQIVMPARGPLLSPGKTHADVAVLRQRLKAGDPPAAADGSAGNPEFYDDELAQAVKAYQRDNGMTVDGLVGTRTRASLNGGKRRVDEGLLIANMEAWRWMPEDLGSTYVAVNLPEYAVRVVKEGRVIHEERIIVGELDKQTPVFSHEMETVVMHPFWGVPNSIKVNELLPSLARGSSLDRRGLRLQYNGRDIDPQSVDWSRADIRNYHVYQPPGGGNVLGVVKFMFPNKHQVYMHDTPSKSLFNQSQRTFSHGCMRVRNPMKLAEVVLREDKGWSAEKVAHTLRTGPQNNNIQLESKIPVHVTYFTAWVDDDGQLQSRPDVYRHEQRIRLALADRWDEIPRHRDHLLPVQYVRPKVFEQPNNALDNFFQTLFGGF